MLQATASAKATNLIGSMGNAAEAKVAAPPAKDVRQDKTVGADQSTQPPDDKPQKFEQALSHATTAQKPETKTPAAKPKTTASDTSDSSKTEQPVTPDIALLMSLLPALPPSDPASAAATTAPGLPAPDDAVTVAAVGSATSGRAASTPVTELTLALPQLATGDGSSTPAAAVVAANASTDATAVGEVRLPDKSDLFSAVLANVDSSTPASVPMLAVPTHQAPTLTAVAQALPVTAPGSLDELPISHNEWPAALGHRLLWAVGEGMQKAEISISPQDMGPISVHIRIENDKADIRFTAAHAQTREVLESSMPRLRDMFSQQGLNLSQAQVFSQGSHDGKGRQPDASPANNGAAPGSASPEVQESEKPRVLHWRRGLVDDYA